VPRNAGGETGDDRCVGTPHVRVRDLPDAGTLAWWNRLSKGGEAMTLSGKDVLATVLTGLAVLTHFAAVGSWDVALVGSSNRWAAGAILLLGLMTCSLGSPAKGLSEGKNMDVTTMLLAAVGVAALVFALWAVLTGSATALSLLIASVVVLWAGSTARHAWHSMHRPLTA
jgi:hypothetical protein